MSLTGGWTLQTDEGNPDRGMMETVAAILIGAGTVALVFLRSSLWWRRAGLSRLPAKRRRPTGAWWRQAARCWFPGQADGDGQVAQAGRDAEAVAGADLSQDHAAAVIEGGQQVSARRCNCPSATMTGRGHARVATPPGTFIADPFVPAASVRGHAAVARASRGPSACSRR